MANPENMDNNKNTNEKDTNKDVISNLPDHILHEFLVRMPLRNAVRTSVLSREWRDKWKYIQELVLNKDSGFFYRYHDHQFRIYQLLFNHRAQIRKFSLAVPPFMRLSTIDLLILCLSRNHLVCDFTLAPYVMDNYIMPSHFYAFRKLAVVRLSRCTLISPPQFQGFSTLVKIEFQEVQFLPGAFERFISRCPCLESLYLSSKTINMDSLEVAGPSLRIFACHGFVKTIHFKSCPVLAQVTLCTPCYCRENMVLRSTMASSYQRLLQFTSAGDAPNQFPCLKVLDLSMNLNSTKEFTDAYSFIRHSPNLETLIFRLWQKGWDANVLEMIQEQETPNPYLNQLKKIELHCYSGTFHQTALLKYLLTSATGLEYMVIVPASNYKPSVDLRVQTMEYPWASPAARLIVRSPPHNIDD
ncbi:hypothetical protein ABFX02_04G066300 [Erythranthe guttata]